MPRGYGGVAILWKKNLDKLVTTLPIGNERIQCIELSGNQQKLYIYIYLSPLSSSNFKLRLKYELPCRNSEVQKQSISNKVKWNKTDKDKYKSLIEEGIALLKDKPQNPTELDEAFVTLNHTITKATVAVAPKKKTKKKKKKLQIMTENIFQAISKKKIAFFKWKQNCRPSDPNNSYTLQKKMTTSSLQKQCRIEVALHKIQERQKIIDTGYNDSLLFYSLIKKQRGKLSRFIEELTVKEELFLSPENVMKGWNKHFGDLAKKSNNTSFDTKYLKSVEKEAFKICKDKYIHQEISNEEIKKAVSKLNTNKAEDFNGVTAEYFIHGSESLLLYLQQLFALNSVTYLLKIGTLFQMYKNKGDIKNDKKI
ncbi:unnamed protein product [Mytilus coruscus]|uniref:Uncharacterized protein n=1 Tax=Mytilus coruscus TaxID=42192 RepID=A0A6J8AU43_MYTCO|nr:unnamed protein product [Mytilus coruscus]